MSTITTELRAPAIVRSSALRAADGVIAGYVRSLAHTAGRPAGDADGTAGGAAGAEGVARSRLGRLAAQAYGCGASRSTGLAARRRPVLRPAASPA